MRLLSLDEMNVVAGAATEVRLSFEGPGTDLTIPTPPSSGGGSTGGGNTGGNPNEVKYSWEA
ncbi:hypothetical protein IGB42_01976 [Andreprevotia sp. IGB-42]|uniref:hypothetical protein n=1 Tax=Andreprevotia sp. IGB-42 TaxID=2497473 RepID=UPI001357B34E|nr:hypothetical protein [Andreprevotia sp. IGB-42]KAF0813625.1 hypothetical protein IGB42_01976 [Andreprevotia sp. IGB-42]